MVKFFALAEADVRQRGGGIQHQVGRDVHAQGFADPAKEDEVVQQLAALIRSTGFLVDGLQGRVFLAVVAASRAVGHRQAVSLLTWRRSASRCARA